MSINLEVILDNFFHCIFEKHLPVKLLLLLCWCLVLTDFLQTSWTYWKNCKARGGQDLTAHRKKSHILNKWKILKKGSLSLNKFFHISKRSFIVWKVCWMVPYLKKTSLLEGMMMRDIYLWLCMYASMYLCTYVGKTLYEVLLVHVTICWFSHQFVSY